MKLKHKLTASMISLALILILFNTFFFVKVMHNEIKQEKSNLYQGIAELMLRNFQDASSGIVSSFFESCNSDGIGNLLSFQSPLQVKRMQLSMKLNSFVSNTANHVTAACFADLEGELFYPQNISEGMTNRFRDLYDRYVAASDSDTIWINDGGELFLCRSIYMLAPYQKQGYVIGKIDMDYLLNQLGVSSVPGGMVILSSGKGEILFTYGADGTAPSDLEQLLFLGKQRTGQWIEYEIEGIDVLLYCQNGLRNTWTILLVMPYQVMMASYNRIFRNTLVISAILLLAATGLALLFSHGITLNISRLVRSIRKMRKENAYAEIRLKGNDEIAEVATEMNRLMQSINDLHAAQYDLLELRYRFIQSKINPHFMSNILSSIASYSMMGDQEQMEQLCIKTSSYLKSNIADSQSRLISVEQEIKNAEECIEIYQMISSLELCFSMSCPQKVKNLQMISMVLQPLVENAVLHASKEGQQQKLHIDLKAWEDHNRIYLEVSDDGCGMEEEMINRIERLKAEPMTEGTPNGFGIGAVIRRLQLQYGKNYCFDVRSKPDRGTKITICLPKIDLV